jgi:hypothetical protein
MCLPCQQKALAQQQNVYIPPESVEGCITTLVELAQLKTKLECFLTNNLFINTTQYEVYSVLGAVQSMINTGNYCLYDLTSFKNRIENVTCT